MLKMQPVESSSIRAVGYDRNARALWVEYRSAPGVYRYDGVPHSEFLKLQKAASKGGYVNRMIKGRFSYEYRAGPPGARQQRPRG